MNIALIAAAVLIGVVVIVFLAHIRIAPTYGVSANEIPELINQLQRSGKDGHFAVLMFDPPGFSNDGNLNLQYSIEDGVVGFDWVLLEPRNIADQARVIELASKLGHHLEEYNMNDVRYLRTTGDGIAEIGKRIIQDIHRIDPNKKLDMITEGFAWQPAVS